MTFAADTDLAAVASAIADRTRATMLAALLDGRALTGVELARLAGVAPSTASEHLSRLVGAGLVSMEPSGRHRYYRVASAEVADALERLGSIAPPQDVHSLRQARVGEALRRARSCYDHLAGRVATELVAGWERRGALVVRDGAFEVTAAGAEELAGLGVELDPLRTQRRAFARQCLDWSERRHHLAGAVGAAVLEQLLSLGWLRRQPGSRALLVTPDGRAGLAEQFGVTDF